MAKKYNFAWRNQRTKQMENTGYMEIRDAAAGGGVELYIYGDIVASDWERWGDEDVCPQGVVDFLNQIKADEDLTVYINSGGGDCFAGIAIYNVLTRHTGHKRGVVDGIAASIASVILMACDEIVMSTGAQIMIHKPLTFGYGNADDFAKAIEALDKCQQSITAIYMKRAKEGVTEDEITSLIDAETRMSAKEAQEIFSVKVEERPAVAACVGWMMDRYTNKTEGIETVSVKDAETAEAAKEEEDAMLEEMELFGI